MGSLCGRYLGSPYIFSISAMIYGLLASMMYGRQRSPEEKKKFQLSLLRTTGFIIGVGVGRLVNSVTGENENSDWYAQQRHTF